MKLKNKLTMQNGAEKKNVISKGPGVYVVYYDPNKIKLECPPIEKKRIKDWKANSTRLSIKANGQLISEIPTVIDEIYQYLCEFWIYDTSILYIGQTNGSLNRRINDYFCHVIGDKNNHNGGQWIKTLSILGQTIVHWVPVVDKNPKVVEEDLLNTFYQKYGRLPFANIRYWDGFHERSKNKRIRYQCRKDK